MIRKQLGQTNRRRIGRFGKTCGQNTEKINQRGKIKISKTFDTKRLTRLGLFTALALIMGLIENSLPPLLVFAPGVKMGLANVVSLIAMIILGTIDAYVILIVRCLLLSIFAGNVTALMYSVPAGLAALTIQLLMYKFLFPRVSLMAASFVGAVTHNVTQLVIASIIVKTNLLAVLPLTLAASIIAGLFVGITAWATIKYLPKSIYITKAKRVEPPQNT